MRPTTIDDALTALAAISDNAPIRALLDETYRLQGFLPDTVEVRAATACQDTVSDYLSGRAYRHKCRTEGHQLFIYTRAISSDSVPLPESVSYYLQACNKLTRCVGYGLVMQYLDIALDITKCEAHALSSVSLQMARDGLRGRLINIAERLALIRDEVKAPGDRSRISLLAN